MNALKQAPALLPAETIAEELGGALFPCLLPTTRDDYPYRLGTLFGMLWVSPCDGAIRMKFECDSVVPDEGYFNHETRQWSFENLKSMTDLARAAFSLKCVIGGDPRGFAFDARLQGLIDAEDKEIEARDRELRRADREMMGRFYKAINEGIPYEEMDFDLQRWWWNRY